MEDRRRVFLLRHEQKANFFVSLMRVVERSRNEAAVLSGTGRLGFADASRFWLLFVCERLGEDGDDEDVPDGLGWGLEVSDASVNN